ncbi:MAG TPA: hydroxyacid dehydrogenase [Pseudonocardiaceae bacterium]|nr:hydroxyacid dehydrogenase [Pseudonocardiaceae bacterium]
MGEPITAALAMFEHLPPLLFPPPLTEKLRATAHVQDRVLTTWDGPLTDVDVLITGWGCPPIDAAVLAAAPRLRAVIHAAGTVKGHVGAAVFERGIVVSSAAAVNARPVAEYTLAMILLANKEIRAMAQRYRAERRKIEIVAEYPAIGNLGRTVGVLGASRVGREVLRLLAPFDLHVLLTDPYVTAAEAADLGAELVELPELFRRGDIVTVHAPAIPETRGLVDAALLALLADGATLINTARGAVVDQDALLAHLRTGRISAVLDVTEPEVPPADSPLWQLPNVLLTPHAAGAAGTELSRLGACAVDELGRFAAGEPLAFAVELAQLAVMA